MTVGENMRRYSAVAIAGSFLMAAGSFGVPAALAHDAVVGGNPADGETLTEFPSTVTLDFSGVPKDGFNTIALSDQDQNILFTGEPEVVDQSITIDLPSDLNPGPGEYTIGFQITSSDGHATKGKTTFTVAGEGGTAAAPDTAQLEENANASSSEPTEDSFNPTVAILGSLAALFAVGAVIVLLLKRNKMGQ